MVGGRRKGPTVGERPRSASDRREPTRRVVVVGASNVTRAFPIIVDLLRRRFREPLDLLFALGHGRSYGRWSTVGFRGLPGVVDCGLWQALQSREPLPTSAVLTDVGNDLFYSAAVPDITGWVETCLDRLAPVVGSTGTTTLTELPVLNLPRVTPGRYWAMRSILFPGCRTSYSTMLEQSLQLNERLLALAQDRGVPVQGHQASWYGVDPIHVLSRRMTTAWRHYLSPVTGDVTCPVRGLGVGVPNVYTLAPDERRLFGVLRRRAQPVFHLADGTRCSLY